MLRILEQTRAFEAPKWESTMTSHGRAYDGRHFLSLRGVVSKKSYVLYYTNVKHIWKYYSIVRTWKTEHGYPRIGVCCPPWTSLGSSKFCSYEDKLSVVVLFRCFVCAYVCNHMLKVFKFASQLNYSEGQVRCGYMLCMLPSCFLLIFTVPSLCYSHLE